MKKFIFIIIAVTHTFLHAQSNDIQIEEVGFNFGFTIEVPFVLYKNMNTNTGVVKTEANRMLGIHLSGRILFNNFAFEFRPGFVMDKKEHYSGIEYGFYVRYLFSNTSLYLVAGLNIHENFGESHNGATVMGGTFVLPNISFGCQLSKTLGVLISYYHPIETYKLFRETKWGEEGMMGNDYTIHTGNLIGVFAIGVDWTF